MTDPVLTRPQIIGKSVSEWLETQPEFENGLLFLLNRKTVASIIDSGEMHDGLPGNYPRILKLFDCPVFPDDAVPIGEVHMRDNAGKLLGKITGLAL